MKPQTPEEMKAEYSKVIQENMPFGFEYYNELFEWIIAKRNEHTRQAIKYALEDAAKNVMCRTDLQGNPLWVDKSSILSRYESICNDLDL